MTRVYRWSVTCDEDGCPLWWASFAVTVGQQRSAARAGGWRLGRREDLCPEHNPGAVRDGA